MPRRGGVHLRQESARARADPERGTIPGQQHRQTVDPCVLNIGKEGAAEEPVSPAAQGAPWRRFPRKAPHDLFCRREFVAVAVGAEAR